MKDIELRDVIHLYFNQECEISNLNKRMILEGWEEGRTKISGYLVDCFGDCIIKPILRSLDSMTEEEKSEFKKLIPWIDFQRFIGSDRWEYVEYEELSKHEVRPICKTSAGINTLPMVVMPYLLSKGFDLFSLIERGHAIKKEV